MFSQPFKQPVSSSLGNATAMLPGAQSTDSLRATQTALSVGSMADRSIRNRTIMFAATALIGILGLSLAIFMLWRGNRTPAFTQVKVTRITANGKASNAAISPD